MSASMGIGGGGQRGKFERQGCVSQQIGVKLAGTTIGG